MAATATRRAAAATTTNKEEERIKREDPNNRRNRRSSREKTPVREKHCGCISKNGIRLYNPLPYLVNIQTPAVVPPPRGEAARGCVLWVSCASLAVL